MAPYPRGALRVCWPLKASSAAGRGRDPELPWGELPQFTPVHPGRRPRGPAALPSPAASVPCPEPRGEQLSPGSASCPPRGAQSPRAGGADLVSWRASTWQSLLSLKTTPCLDAAPSATADYFHFPHSFWGQKNPHGVGGAGGSAGPLSATGAQPPGALFRRARRSAHSGLITQFASPIDFPIASEINSIGYFTQLGLC